MIATATWVRCEVGHQQTLVADLTVNTDFAQVEDDEQQINLTRFSVLFPEKRDFFLEGADTFNFANGSTGTGRTGSGGGTQGSSQNTSTAPLLFYSRRIGFKNGLTVPIWESVAACSAARDPGSTARSTCRPASPPTRKRRRPISPSCRVNHDLFRRSRVGGIVTRRDPIAATLPGRAAPTTSRTASMA